MGSDQVLTDPYDLDRYSADALTPFRAFGVDRVFERLADVVVRPASTREVSEVVALAARQGHTGNSLRGAAPGLWGGVLTAQGGIVIDLKGGSTGLRRLTPLI